MAVKKITALKAQGAPKSGAANAKRKAILAAQETNLLPHEWLLKVARGEPVEHHVGTRDAKTGKITYEKTLIYPDCETRIDAAKAAAPYYAPKLAMQTISANSGKPENIAEQLRYLADKLPV